MPDFDALDAVTDEPVVIEQDFSIYEDKSIHWETPPDIGRLQIIGSPWTLIRDGIEELKLQGNYLYFGNSTHAKIDGSGMDKRWFGHDNNRYSNLMKSEEVFRRHLLQGLENWSDYAL